MGSAVENADRHLRRAAQRFERLISGRSIVCILSSTHTRTVPDTSSMFACAAYRRLTASAPVTGQSVSTTWPLAVRAISGFESSLGPTRSTAMTIG